MADERAIPWRHLAGAAGCVLVGWLAFGRDEPVPLLRSIDLCLHEFGHVAALWLPTVVTASMGSIVQVAIPLAIAAYFLIARRDAVGGGLCLSWAGTSARDASVYIADAPYERLPLIGGEHDWARVLGPAHCDCLERAAGIASTVRGLGLALVALGTAACLIGPLRGRPGWTRREPDERPTAASEVG